MKDDEQKLADSMGKFVQVVVDGRKRNNVDWLTGRFILSNKRLVLVSNEGKRTIPLSNITGVKAGSNVNEAIAKVSGYLSLQVGTNVTLISPEEIDEFEAKLYDALLDQEVVLVKHPAVKGGVIQDTDWEKGRVRVDDDTVNLALANGTFVELLVDDVASVERDQKIIMDQERVAIEAEHTADDGSSVQTHISGGKQTVSILESFVRRSEKQNTVDVDLTQKQNEVLMALYSGVSPFQIPSFVGMDVDEVEEIFQELIEHDILEEVRVRKDVELEARGRSIAAEAMSEQ